MIPRWENKTRFDEELDFAQVAKPATMPPLPLVEAGDDSPPAADEGRSKSVALRNSVR